MLQGKTIIIPLLEESKLFLTLEGENLEIITSHQKEVKTFDSTDIDDINLYISSEVSRIYSSLEEDIEIIDVNESFFSGEELPQLKEEIDIEEQLANIFPIVESNLNRFTIESFDEL